MSVQTFSLTDSIRITPEAAQHFSDQLARSGHRAVRITLKESGCSGYMYNLEEIDAPVEQDVAKQLDNGVTVYFDPADAVALRGTEIDYRKEGLNRTLKFLNPNATDACGCGESFNIDLETARGES